MAIIILFKTRQQLETENTVKVIREWEAHWQNLVDRKVKEERLSRQEIRHRRIPGCAL